MQQLLWCLVTHSASAPGLIPTSLVLPQQQTGKQTASHSQQQSRGTKQQHRGSSLQVHLLLLKPAVQLLQQQQQQELSVPHQWTHTQHSTQHNSSSHQMQQDQRLRMSLLWDGHAA
jgi:hypothetical protein